MAVRAIFRTCTVAPVNDNATYLGASTGVISTEIGMPTPNNAYNKGAGLQRIDSIADVTQAESILAGATFTVPLAGITTTSRTLVRVTGPVAFTVTITPSGGSATPIGVVGSALMPGIYECTFESLTALTVTNNDPSQTAVFTLCVANVVDYNDGRVSNLVP